MGNVHFTAQRLMSKHVHGEQRVNGFNASDRPACDLERQPAVEQALIVRTQLTTTSCETGVRAGATLTFSNWP